AYGCKDTMENPMMFKAKQSGDEGFDSPPSRWLSGPSPCSGTGTLQKFPEITHFTNFMPALRLHTEGKAGGAQPLLDNGLSGSARFALFLLCSSGALLSSHTAPYMLGPDKQQAIIKELRSSFEKLLNDYQQEERGVPERSQYQMPYFALNPQLPYSEDCSATCLTAERSNHLSITKLKLLPSQTISVNSNFDMNQKQRFLCLQRALNVKKLHRVYF
ncbi:hypothetical protein E2I00_018271, partial [Balaenoptera physalus]